MCNDIRSTILEQAKAEIDGQVADYGQFDGSEALAQAVSKTLADDDGKMRAIMRYVPDYEAHFPQSKGASASDMMDEFYVTVMEGIYLDLIEDVVGYGSKRLAEASAVDVC